MLYPTQPLKCHMEKQVQGHSLTTVMTERPMKGQSPIFQIVLAFPSMTLTESLKPFVLYL